MTKLIAGIQQLGVGIPKVYEAFEWYNKTFGVDIKVFEEAATAKLMLPYTGGEPRDRHAILAINLESGGGFEIWQYTSRVPQAPAFEVQIGDLGIQIGKIKSRNVDAAFKSMQAQGVDLLGKVSKAPCGRKHFYLKDPYNNIFEIIEGYGWFKNEKKATGGVFGAVIGVSDMESSMKFYSDILGYDQVVFDKTDVFADFSQIPGGKSKIRRVVLKHSKARVGFFAALLGPSEIELIQVLDRSPKRIFEDRFWGDLGFIHLCFDISGMADLKAECEKRGHPFTVDSLNSFDMGEAAGHFTYCEDPDGTLIEFVETHKLPLLKKFGIFLDLRKRNPEKGLPNWILKAMAMNRVKFK